MKYSRNRMLRYCVGHGLDSLHQLDPVTDGEGSIRGTPRVDVQRSTTTCCSGDDESCGCGSTGGTLEQDTWIARNVMDNKIGERREPDAYARDGTQWLTT